MTKTVDPAGAIGVFRALDRAAATPSPRPAGHDGTDLADDAARITGWLVAFALASDDEAALLEGFCALLAESAAPVFRVATGAEALHPTFDARGLRWTQARGVDREEVLHDRDRLADEEWLHTPFGVLVASGAPEMRRRVGESYVRGEFELLDTLHDRDGLTDYFSLAVRYGEGSTLGAIPGVLVSYQTACPGGFSEAGLRLLRVVTPAFALAYKTIASVHTGRSLLATYLGSDPARRVLAGAVIRGTAEPVQAVIWYSDLAGFTKIADTAPQDELLPLLNDYADCVVSTVGARGGEVLKFMGDGILAMFPIEEGVYDRALDAAEEVLVNIADLQARRSANRLLSTDVHLALHVGEVLYGNVGSRERLDFTVVGPAVNEAARIEAMCRSLDQRLLVSSAFAHALGGSQNRLVSVGRYALRGVRRPEELFTVDVDRRRP